MTRLVGRRLGAVGATVIFFVYGLPIYWLVATSLKTNAQIVGAPAAVLFTPTTQAYSDIARSSLVTAIANSTTIALATTILVLLLAAPAAYGLARARGRPQVVGLAALILLQMVPPATAIIPLFRTLAAWHLLGGRAGLILADVALLLPISIILLRPFVLSVPSEVEEAAMVDGAGRFTTFSRVVLPLIRNGLITIGSLVFIITWGEFLYAITILADPSAYPISALISQQIGQFVAFWPRLMALAVVGSLPTLAAFLILRRQLLRGLSVGAVK